MSVDDRIARARHDVAYGELPELTRALRALGSSRREAGAMQAQFFRPLLDARRRAEGARSAAARVRAFNAGELAAALDRSVDRIVAEWPDARESARRAVRASVTERVRAYRESLDGLAQAAELLDAAADSDRESAWRAWTAQLQRAFQCADHSWLELRSVVGALSAPKAR